MEAQAALERAAGPIVLDPVAAEGEHGAVVGVDGHLDVDLPIGVGEEDTDGFVQLEELGSAVHILVHCGRERRHLPRLVRAPATVEDPGRRTGRSRREKQTQRATPSRMLRTSSSASSSSNGR